MRKLLIQFNKTDYLVFQTRNLWVGMHVGRPTWSVTGCDYSYETNALTPLYTKSTRICVSIIPTLTLSFVIKKEDERK